MYILVTMMMMMMMIVMMMMLIMTMILMVMMTLVLVMMMLLKDDVDDKLWYLPARSGRYFGRLKVSLRATNRQTAPSTRMRTR